jgi:hypothetical protein
LMGILLKCRLLLVVKAFSQYCVCQSMNIEIFPFSIVFFDFFLSSMVCSFPCRGHLHPLLSLLLDIWFFFWGYCKWNCFPIFFLNLFMVGV